jgi:hypothetical protein
MAATGLPARSAHTQKRKPEYTMSDEPTTSTASAASSAALAASTRVRGTFSPKNTTAGFSMPPQTSHTGTRNAARSAHSMCASPSAAGSALAPAKAGLSRSRVC